MASTKATVRVVSCTQRSAACPWMELEPPPFRTLKVYALDPSAGNYVGNVMSVKIKWEDLKPGFDPSPEARGQLKKLPDNFATGDLFIDYVFPKN